MRHLAAATVSRVVSLPSIWTGDYTKIAKLARRRASRAGSRHVGRTGMAHETSKINEARSSS